MLRTRWLTAFGIWALLAAVAWAQTPYKALIVDGQNAHHWKDTTPVLKKLLEETELFTVDVATSPAKGAGHERFQARTSPRTTWWSRNYQGDDWPEETQQGPGRLRGGRRRTGCLPFRLAAFPQWKEYNEMIGLGGWGGRNEKDGPYVRWRDGEFVRDSSPGRGGGHGPMQPFQVVVRNAEPSHHQGPAHDLHARARRTLRLAPRPGQEPDRAGHRFRAQGQGRIGRTRTAAVHRRATAKAAWCKMPSGTPPRN